MFKFVEKYIHKQLDKWSASESKLLGNIGWNIAGTSEDHISFENLAKWGYQRNPWGYACIFLTSSSVAGLPWQVFSETNGERSEVTAGPLVDLLKRPNPQTSTASYFKTLVTQLEIGGEAYQYGAPDITASEPTTAPPRFLIIPPNSNVTPEMNGDNFGSIRYRVNIGSQSRDFTSDEMLQIKYTSPTDPLRGTSPLEAAYHSLMLYKDAQIWLRALLKNSGRMSNAWVRRFENATLTPEARKAFEEWIDRMFTGPQNAGSNVISELYEPKPLTYGPMDMGIIDLKEDARAEICSALGVPPMLVGDVEKKSSFSNFEQAIRHYFDRKIIPTAQIIRDELNVWLTPKFGSNLVIDFDQESIQALAEDANKQAERLERLVKQGILLINEARRELGLDEIPEGDEALVDANRFPLSGIVGMEPQV